MFGVFKSPSFSDPQLGDLLRSRGLWRGSITVTAGAAVPLAIAGARGEPDAQALQAAREVASQFSSWRSTIEAALFEHYLPYAEPLAGGELPPPSDGVPRLEIPSHVWPHVLLVFVSVTPLDNVLTTELGYTTAWDEEHTLGARFQAGKFVELCGSVLSP
jgi:hypothetical protein